MTVLFVDDDQEDYEVFCDALSVLDQRAVCIHSSNGQDALGLLENLLPDYIFLDVNMPVMDGKECLKHIKRNPKLKDIPVIGYSTTTKQDEVKNFVKLGAKHFISKPAHFNELVENSQVNLRMTYHKPYLYGNLSGSIQLSFINRFFCHGLQHRRY